MNDQRPRNAHYEFMQGERGWYYCWLIERRDREQPEWLTASGDWTKDANKALWFARKNDADIHSLLLVKEARESDAYGGGRFNPIVCEHGFAL